MIIINIIIVVIVTIMGHRYGGGSGGRRERNEGKLAEFVPMDLHSEVYWNKKTKKIR